MKFNDDSEEERYYDRQRYDERSMMIEEIEDQRRAMINKIEDERRKRK